MPCLSPTTMKLAIACILSLLLAPPAALHAVDKPNIVLIVADDLGYAALGSYGQRLILKGGGLDR